MVTDCEDPEALERRMKMPQKFRAKTDDLDGNGSQRSSKADAGTLSDALQTIKKPNARPYPRDLPEAVALSENEIFVMEPEEKHPYTWFRGPPKGKGLTFIFDGPSVLRFLPKGVVVEGVPNWRFGTAIFEESLGDDWHLIRADDDKWTLVRLSETE